MPEISSPAPPGASLTINGTSVFWFRNSVLIRKFSFPKPVIAAEFVRFEDVDSVAILVDTSIHVYSLSGSVDIVALPFTVSFITSSPYGLVLSRDFSSADADDQAPKFYLISNPLVEPEPIYSSTLTSVFLTEELVHFGQDLSSPFCITYDQSRSEISVYHVRTHKPTHIFDPQYNSEFNTSSESDMKYLMLTSVVSFQLETTLSGLNVISASNNGQTAIAISPNQANTVHVIIFGTDGLHTTSAQSTVQSVKSFDLIGSSPLFITAFKTHPILLILHSPTSFYLCDPFLDLKSLIVSLPSHWSNIYRLGFYKDGDSKSLIYATSSLSPNTPKSPVTYYNLYLPLEPTHSLVAKIFDGLRQILDQRAFQCIAFGWSLLLVSENSSFSEWEALVAIIVAQMFPEFASYLSSQKKSSNSGKTTQLKDMFSDYKVESFTFDQIIPMALNLVSAFPEDSRFGSELQPHIILIFHYIREELRLESAYTKDLNLLGTLLTYLELWSAWPSNWVSSYGVKPLRKQRAIIFSTPPVSSPPNIFSAISSFFSSSQESSSFPLPSEIYKDNSLDEVLIPNAITICRFFALANQDINFVEFFQQPNISKKFLNSLSMGVQYAMYECLRLASQYFALDDNVKLWDILSRNDLLLSSSNKSLGNRDLITHNTSKEVTISSKDTLSHIGSVCESEYMTAWDEQTENDRNQISRLIFSSDRRFYEVSKLLQSSNPRVLYMPISPNMSDGEILAKQEEIFYSSVLRTCTVPMGRAAFYFSARKPLATEKYPIPRLNFTVILKPRDVTITLQKDGISEENLSWGYFHNGVSAGLSLSKTSPCVNGNWIVFNKPQHLNSQHAGFLLGIGLNGHLKNLEEWHIYNYLGPKHRHTSIALLIGMAASHLGSMNTKLTKVLSVHIFALLPPGSNDLNVPVEVQTAGVIGMGLLYLESSHRRMTETFLAELEGRTKASISSIATNPSGSGGGTGPGSNPNGIFSFNNGTQTSESYKLATGFALGLINLCKAHDLKGLHDVKIVDRLISRIVNPRDVQTSQLEISIPGAIAALLLMFLKSENKGVSEKVQPPTNAEAYDYIRPDFLLLRAAGAKLIMWNEMIKYRTQKHTENKGRKSKNANGNAGNSWNQWINSSIPEVVKQSMPKSVLKELGDPMSRKPNVPNQNGKSDLLWETVGENSTFNENNLKYSTDYLPYYYIRCGLCFALAIRFASSCDEEIRDLLLEFLDFVCVMTESSSLAAAAANNINDDKISVGNTHDLQLFRQALLHIQNTLCLCVAMIMCGSGDLYVLRRLRRLALKTRKDTCGVNLAVSQALGYLFLGGGQYRFDVSSNIFDESTSASNSSLGDNSKKEGDLSNRNIAFLIISNWPVYPRVLVDNASYLQPLRYLWALSTKMCCVTVREVETDTPCDIDLVIKSLCDPNEEIHTNDSGGTHRFEMVCGKKLKVVRKKAPCLLSSLKNVVSIETSDDRYSQVRVDLIALNKEEKHVLRDSFLKTYTLFVTKRRTFLSKATDILHSPSNINLGSSSLMININSGDTNSVVGSGNISNALSKSRSGKGQARAQNNSSSSNDVCSLFSSLKIFHDVDISCYLKDQNLMYRSLENGPITVCSSENSGLQNTSNHNVTETADINTNNNSLLFSLLSAARKPHTSEDLWHLKTVFDAREYVKRKEEENNNEGNEYSKGQDGVVKEDEDFKIEEMKALLWKWKNNQSVKEHV